MRITLIWLGHCPISFKKDVEWCWTSTEAEAFKFVKESLLHAPILALQDSDQPFSVVCDASDLAIGCVTDLIRASCAKDE